MSDYENEEGCSCNVTPPCDYCVNGGAKQFEVCDVCEEENRHCACEDNHWDEY